MRHRIVVFLIIGMLVFGLSVPRQTANAQDTLWTAQYFNNIMLQGLPAVTRAEAEINHDWRTGQPDPAISSDNFSVRWTRVVDLTVGNYQFTLSGDDGVRFFIDNTLIIDQWRDQSFSTYNIVVPVAEGTHTLRVEYYDRTGSARVVFSYMPVAGSDGGSVSSTVRWQAEYFANSSLRGNPQLVGYEPGGALQRTWGDGSPVAGLPADNFSVRWSRQLCTDGRNYIFTVTVDDGARMYIGDVPIFNIWTDAANQRYQQPVDLTIGCYDLVVEYREVTGNASIDLTWSSPEGVVLPSLGGPSPIPIAELTAIVTTGRLNMRNGPGVNFDIVSGLFRSQEVAVNEIDPVSGWARVTRADGVTGWVNADFIQYIDDTFIGFPIQGKLTAGLNLRSGPATAFTILDTLNWGTVVDVIGRTADGTWLQVQVNNQIGWVLAEFVEEASGRFFDAPITR